MLGWAQQGLIRMREGGGAGGDTVGGAGLQGQGCRGSRNSEKSPMEVFLFDHKLCEETE